jgi:transcription-repair coupling factor (superfamily II helicase)
MNATARPLDVPAMVKEAARTAFRARWRERMEGDPTKARIYKDIASGIATGGIEY